MILATKYVIKMDEQRRIEIERSVIESTFGVRLSGGETVRLWAFIGSHRQLQVLAPSNELAKVRERFDEGSLSEHPWDSTGDEALELIRRVMSLIGISCACEPKRSKLRITVDAE